MRILITGGAGFIGSAVVRHLIEWTDHDVLNVDLFTYAATEGSTADARRSDRFAERRIDICDRPAVDAAVAEFDPDAVMHLAAESHVDRSIDDPGAFVRTNLLGTYELLDAAAAHGERRRSPVRFVHVSTDEVFGSLSADDPAFTPTTPYRPRSPYSASKAGADHLARAWYATFGLPVIVTNCSNNYGPYQFPEKLIPLMILNAAAELPLPVYGAGDNVRDWLHVDDHAAGLVRALEAGHPGETYLFGGHAERSNLEVVHRICDEVDAQLGVADAGPRRRLVEFVTDRPGHDHRYAVDSSHAEDALDWAPSVDFDTGIADTVRWFLANEEWWAPLRSERYAGQRLGRARGA